MNIYKIVGRGLVIASYLIVISSLIAATAMSYGWKATILAGFLLLTLFILGGIEDV